jgi:hypothetical protein
MKNEEILKHVALDWNETEVIKKRKGSLFKKFFKIYVSSDKTYLRYRCSKSCGVKGVETPACLCYM